MIKKLAAISLSMVLSVGLLAGCGSSNNNNQGKPAADQSSGKEAGQTGGYAPQNLTVQFVPSQNAETLEAKAKPLEKLLGDKLGIPVKVSVSTNYNTIIEAMASKKVDVGFLPPTAYVLAHEKKAADVILQAQRYGIKQPGGENTKELVDYYNALILVRKDSGIKDVKDLKGKKVAYQDVTSSAGYVWPAVEMQKAGVDPEKDVTPVRLKGHDKAVLALINGEVDAACVFEDARNVVKKDYPDVFDKTTILLTTKPIPNDTISVRPDMDPKWKEKIQQAFIDIAKDPEGNKIVNDIYSHMGYAKSDDSKFDIVREYQKAVGQ